MKYILFIFEKSSTTYCQRPYKRVFVPLFNAAATQISAASSGNAIKTRTSLSLLRAANQRRATSQKRSDSKKKNSYLESVAGPTSAANSRKKIKTHLV